MSSNSTPSGRPPKTIFDQKIQDELRQKAIQKIKEKLLPDEKILKIILIGSSVKGSFGKYEPPGFRGSFYSDFDFIVFIEDDYQIPDWLEREWNGKPFSDEALNLAYRSRKFVDDTYDAEIFFIRQKNMNDGEIQKQAEKAGIAMSVQSRHPHMVVFEKKLQFIPISSADEIDILKGKESHFANFHYQYSHSTIQLLKKNFSRPKSHYLIAKDGEKFAGFCSLDTDWWEPNYFFLREIFVMPEYQCQKIGETFMRRMIDYARENSATGIVTETAFENIPMQKLCEKCGFKQWENPQWKEGFTYKLYLNHESVVSC